MTGIELKTLREAKGWTAAKMASALGYRGSPRTNARVIYALEERDTLPREVEYRLAWANLTVQSRV
jgi:transcriptional regulator with XRE-family HTH domain